MLSYFLVFCLLACFLSLQCAELVQKQAFGSFRFENVQFTVQRAANQFHNRGGGNNCPTVDMKTHTPTHMNMLTQQTHCASQ